MQKLSHSLNKPLATEIPELYLQGNAEGTCIAICPSEREKAEQQQV